MDSLFKPISNAGVTAPTGFWAGGVFCDIKRLGTGKGSNKGQKKDLAIVFSEVDAHVAGMFTTNQVCAARCGYAPLGFKAVWLACRSQFRQCKCLYG
jgi:N-acetylglutamate synthase/N-acetylornithine aminotransferase